MPSLKKSLVSSVIINLADRTDLLLSISQENNNEMCNSTTKNKISQCFQENIKLKPTITKLQRVIYEFHKIPHVH